MFHFRREAPRRPHQVLQDQPHRVRHAPEGQERVVVALAPGQLHRADDIIRQSRFRDGHGARQEGCRQHFFWLPHNGGRV